MPERVSLIAWMLRGEVATERRRGAEEHELVVGHGDEAHPLADPELRGLGVRHPDAHRDATLPGATDDLRDGRPHGRVVELARQSQGGREVVGADEDYVDAVDPEDAAEVRGRQARL